VRASRLVNLLLLLQTRGGLTAAELARELEVSVRTVHRDVDALSAAGVPIYAERGPFGGIRLVDGYRTRLTGMTGDEAEALFLSGIPGPAAELGLGTVVAAARLKVLAALPNELRSRASRLVERFHLDASGWFHTSEAVPHLAEIAENVWEGRGLRIAYDRGGGEVVDRAIGPLGLVLKAGVWYTVALIDGQIRTYRISRIQAVTVLETHVERPADFDLAAYWSESTAAYERDAARQTVLVRIPEARLERLATAVGWAAVDAAERLPDPEAGWLRLRLSLDWPDEIPARLLSAGSSVEVLEPPEVRRRIIATAQRVLGRYGLDVPVAVEPAPADARELGRAADRDETVARS
jgi:predicted DNA-binding transcriptional regulator YafY